jgi:hypothetical protein
LQETKIMITRKFANFDYRTYTDYRVSQIAESEKAVEKGRGCARKDHQPERAPSIALVQLQALVKMRSQREDQQR